MGKIFLTGYSGNVGGAVAKYMTKKDHDFIAGVRSPSKYAKKDFEGVDFRKFDIEDQSTYEKALEGVEKIFLVRPPQITDVEGVFKPFIAYCEKIKIKHLVFLSLLGVEKNPFPPHHKIEKAILTSNIPYTFIRPSFFMQNLIAPHSKEIREKNEIYIPSGKAKISFIDTEDIGEIIARVLLEDHHFNKAYTLTGGEAIDYHQVAKVMSEVLKRDITYVNPGLLKFRSTMIKEGTDKAFANVMTVLYLTTKLGMAKQVTTTAETLLGRKPNTIRDFLEHHKSVWMH